MSKKVKIFYWCPFINKVATVKAVYNSVLSVNKFSKKKYEGVIIDAFGEWKNNDNFEFKKEIFTELKVFPIIKRIPSLGFVFSRMKYILIFIFSYYPLKNLLKKIKPKFLIIHLMTSLPLFLNLFNNFETKIILRISGKPKLNFMRHFFWSLALKKIYKITFPTKETLEYFISLDLVPKNKLHLLYDPIISSKEINYKTKKAEIKDFDYNNKKYFLAIGRLTKQKNFKFLIECFERLILKDKSINLLILGEGEEFNTLKNLTNKLNINNNVLFLGYKNNVFKYLDKCDAFILSSLWEDPGFVILEAMYCNTFVISSDCQSGPKEIISLNRGLTYENNSKEDFLKKLNEFKNLSTNQKFEIKYNAKRFTKNFSLLNHYKTLDSLLINE
tara:strand:- start:13025 stop:14185 length:1161 start_codon:yes stop_codon:yes gene_type:complete